jgi:hypothetical protein
MLRASYRKNGFLSRYPPTHAALFSKATLEIGAPRMDRKSTLIDNSRVHQTRVTNAEHKRCGQL